MLYLISCYVVTLTIITLTCWKMAKWLPKKPQFSSSKKCLIVNNKKHRSVSVQEIIDNSDKFPIDFPVDSVRTRFLQDEKNIPEDVLLKNINSVYVFIHENVLQLYVNFLQFKQQQGSTIEKEFYKNMTINDFIDRLLKKRAVMFMGKYDKYILLTGEKGNNGWDKIGTSAQQHPLLLHNCLSYDEIKLSAFLYVSSYTHLINTGDRKNKAIYCDDRTLLQPTAVIAGMIGPRLKKPHVMDYQEIVITDEMYQLAQLFKEFYEDNPDSAHYVTLPDGAKFNNTIYQKRLAIVFDCLLIEANFRAKEAALRAYVHVVGLGLGVWKISAHQEAVFMECFYQRIKVLGCKLERVSYVCFAHFEQVDCGGVRDGGVVEIEGHPLGGVRIHIGRRRPHEKLSDDGKLLVVSYAWDGNALPGNEFWAGKLGSSGDSAAALSTQITELHNPHINPLVCADNLRIVTLQGSMVELTQLISDRKRKAHEAKCSSKTMKFE